MQIRALVLLTFLVCVVGIIPAASVPGAFSEDLATDRYDCLLTLSPSKSLSKDSTARLILEWDEQKGSVQLVITRQSITVLSFNDGKRTVCGTVNSGVKLGTDYSLLILRRGDSLGILFNNAFILRKTVPRSPGVQAGITVDNGWQVVESRIQRLESVYFSDDFMRTQEEPGSWVVRTGKWMLQSAWDSTPQGNASKFSNASYAQNPFAWVGSNATGSAICTTGESFWEDYSFTAAVRPGKSGAVGLVVNMSDTKNGILTRWTSMNDPRGNQLMLAKVVNGKVIPLKTIVGGFIPNQWYKLTVTSSMDGVRVFIDDRERLAVTGVTPWRGGVGLYAEGEAGATFDDVTVIGQTFNRDLLYEIQQTDVTKLFQNDPNGIMNEWANTKNDWTPAAGIPNHYWYRRDMYGDHVWMTINVKPIPQTTGEIWLVLNGDGQNPTAGYRATVKYDSGAGKNLYTLYRDTTELGKQSGDPLQAGEAYTLRFWRVGARLALEVDGQVVVEANDQHSPQNYHPAYQASGCFQAPSSVVVLSQNMLDYTFSNSPTDWLVEGTWLPTIRWSCSPNWSFLAGWSRGDAVMWHKQRFVGDQELEAYVGIKMEYPNEREAYEVRYRDMSVTICGDGHDPRSGYAGVFAASGEQTKRLLLMRNGTIVASQPLPGNLTPNSGTNHRSWFELTMKKKGATVEFSAKINGQYQTLTYTDPQPIAGGVPAIWTTDNGISIARARISFTNPPMPREDPQVTIDDIWIPEWTNIDQPLVLDFANSHSTSGRPLTLAVVSNEVPAEDAQSFKINGTKVAFTPKVNGKHWYAIATKDGGIRSPYVHLDIPVFKPSLGRDDSHAVVLYRFTEGEGMVVNDQSKIAPAANLTIFPSEKKDAAGKASPSAQWLPRQGLHVDAGSKIVATSPTEVDKLLALSTSKACTIELWLVGETYYPPNNRVSSVFSWALPNGKQNLSLIQENKSLLVGLPNTNFPGNGAARFMFKTGFTHLVISWDGTTTRYYVNGQKVEERVCPWNIDKLQAGGTLVLGNVSKGFGYPFLGSYYLFAIHDRSFTAEEVLRHYNAGPSAQ